MEKSILHSLYRTAKITTSIVTNAQKEMIKTSFKTSKQIAGLYKEAGVEAYKISGSLLKNTVKLAVDNQKQLIETSGKAIKDATQTLRATDIQIKKATNKEVNIDDLI